MNHQVGINGIIRELDKVLVVSTCIAAGTHGKRGGQSEDPP